MKTSDIRPCPNVSEIGHVDSLAKHLGVATERLLTIAENSATHWRAGPDIPKSAGGVRHTHSATRELKEIHDRIKNTILRKTNYPDYLYGSLPKTLERGTRTHIDNAELHTGQRLIISADIKSYFPSITETVVHSIWQGFYPFAREVAEVLTKLTTYHNQAPQGWSCSSYLAQLVFYDVEHEVATHFNEQDFRYSRLTDDITLSTNRILTKQEVTDAVATLNRMLNKKGTGIHRGKTRVDSPARRQSVNKINVSLRGMTLSKEYRKAVRAKVHNVVTNPESFGDKLDRELQSAKGKISYVSKFHKTDANLLKKKIRVFEQSIR